MRPDFTVDGCADEDDREDREYYADDLAFVDVIRHDVHLNKYADTQLVIRRPAREVAFLAERRVGDGQSPFLIVSEMCGV